MKNLFPFFFLLLWFTGNAQSISIVKTTVIGSIVGTDGVKMQPTDDGGIFWVGTTYDTAGGGDYPVCTAHTKSWNVAAGKLDANGNKDWAVSYCNATIEPSVNCPALDKGYLIRGPGLWDSSNQFIPDLFVSGIDCKGKIQWQGQWGSSDIDGFNYVIPTSDGGFLAVGSSYGEDGDVPVHYPSPSNFLYTDIVVLKGDSLHQKQWLTVIGSSTQDGSKNIFQVGDSYYVFADGDGSGHDYDFANSAPYPADSVSSFLVKLDSLGNKVWIKCLGALGVTDALFDEVDSTFMVVSSCALNYPPFYYMDTQFAYYGNYGLAKINMNGQVVWAKNYGAMGYHDIPTGVCKGEGNTYLVVGETHAGLNPPPPRIGESDGWLVWTDSSGNKIADKYFGTTAYDTPEDIERLGMDKYIIGTPAKVTSPFTEGSWHYGPGVAYGEGFTVIELHSTGVSDISARDHSLKVYPNPANNQLMVVFPYETKRYSVTIMNSNGILLATYSNVRQREQTLSTINFPDGNYILKCMDDEGDSWITKFVLSH